MPSNRLIYGTLALLTLIWGTTWAAIRLGLDGLPPLTGLAMRFAVAAVLLLGYAKFKGVPLGGQLHEKRLWVANAFLTMAGPYVFVYWGEQWVPSGLASVIFATFTLLVAVMAHFMLDGERLSILGTLGVMIGFAGIAILFSEDLTTLGGPRVREAALVMFISPFLSAVGQIVIKKWGGHLHPLSLTAVPMAISAAAVGVLALVLERGRPVVLTWVSVGSVLYLAAFGSALAFTLYFWLLRSMTATRLSLIAYMTPVVAVAVGIFLLSEPFTARTVAGSIAVVAGVGLVVARRRRAA